MPEISTKTAVREIPKTTVEDAITRGRRKVQEARSLREMREAARAAQQSAVPVSGMEQGDMLDPFNFTTALKMMGGRGKEDRKEPHGAADGKEPAQNREKPGYKDKKPGKRTEKAKDSSSKEKEADSHSVKEVRTDEQGTVVEEKDVAEPGRKAAGREISTKRIVRTVLGNVPVQAAVLAQQNEKAAGYRSAPAGAGDRSLANLRVTDKKPEELRLNAKPQADSGRDVARDTKSSQSQDARGGDRAEGLVRKEPPGRTLQNGLDTAYESQEHRAAEEHGRAGREREADGRTVAQPAKETVRAEAVTAPAESISRAEAERQTRREEPVKAPLTENRNKAAETPMKEPVSGKDAMNHIIADARENVESGNLVMQAAAITHATGRELQFEKGGELLQIRKEGKETFAYINGEKADIGKARDFMKDLTRTLGPELSVQMKGMLKTLSQNPALSMQQAAGPGKQPVLQPQARGMGAVTRD